MKDILLTAKRQRVELVVFGICLLTAFLLNICSIVAYDTEWKEMYTQIGWVFSISLILYLIVLAFRLFYRFILRRTIQKGHATK